MFYTETFFLASYGMALNERVFTDEPEIVCLSVGHDAVGHHLEAYHLSPEADGVRVSSRTRKLLKNRHHLH